MKARCGDCGGRGVRAESTSVSQRCARACIRRTCACARTRARARARLCGGGVGGGGPRKGPSHPFPRSALDRLIPDPGGRASSIRDRGPPDPSHWQTSRITTGRSRIQAAAHPAEKKSPRAGRAGGRGQGGGQRRSGRRTRTARGREARAGQPRPRQGRRRAGTVVAGAGAVCRSGPEPRRARPQTRDREEAADGKGCPGGASGDGRAASLFTRMSLCGPGPGPGRSGPGPGPALPLF